MGLLAGMKEWQKTWNLLQRSGLRVLQSPWDVKLRSCRIHRGLPRNASGSS